MPRCAVIALAALALSAAPALSAPSIQSVSPGSGPTAGGTTITIIGLGFGSVTGQVFFGSAEASVRQWFVDRITCDLPPGNSGETTVMVTAGGTPSNYGFFQYAAPQIVSLDPASGPSTGGTLLTIHGHNFGLAIAGRVTTIGGVEAPEAQYIGHDEIVVTVPEGIPGPSPVRVRLNGWASNSVSFTYLEPAAVPFTRASGFALGQNRPNPVTGETLIPIELAEASAYSVEVFDVRGRFVRRFDGTGPSGVHTLRWDATDASGRRAPPGLYFYRFVAPGRYAATRRLLLTR